MKKIYAVKNGRNTGIFGSWDECKKQTDKYPNAVFKSFTNIEDAKKYLADYGKTDKLNYDKNEMIVYVDGSFNKTTCEYGYGVVIIYRNETIEICEKGLNKDYSKYMNVAGEIEGVIASIKYAIEKGCKKIIIHYDYTGIENWANRNWRANNELTKGYVDFIEDSFKSLNISFVKVKAHTGIELNERADYLAKKAVGVIV